MNPIQTTRRLEIDAGHRLLGHEGKCRHVHGHRYVFDVTVEADALDGVGRVLDFGVVKEKLGSWLDESWDHGLILQEGDPLIALLGAAEPQQKLFVLDASPSAENLAAKLLDVATELLPSVRVVRVRCWETPNCYAEATR